MTTDDGSGLSDAELRVAVLEGWHRLVTSVPPGADRLDTLATRTGMPFRQLDMARRVRDQIAHPDQPVPRERLLAACRIIADAEQRLDSCKRTKPGETDRQASRDRAIGYRRLTLRPPASRSTSQHKQTPRHIVFYVTTGEKPAQKLIPLNALGLSTDAATVTCDTPWLNGAIIGDSVRLIAKPLGTAGKLRGLARISSHGNSVTLTVDMRVSGPPQQAGPTTPPTDQAEAGWTVARVVLVALFLGVLLLLAISLT